MTPLVWANFPLMALFALAIAGIPMWMVIRHPDRAPDHSEAHAYLRARAEQLGHAGPGTARPDIFLPPQDSNRARGAGEDLLMIRRFLSSAAE